MKKELKSTANSKSSAKSARSRDCRRNRMIHHYITQYIENGEQFAESWVQINLFGKCFCLSRRKIKIHEIKEDH